MADSIAQAEARSITPPGALTGIRVLDFTWAIRLLLEHVDEFHGQGISQEELDKPRVSRLLTRIFSRTKQRD